MATNLTPEQLAQLQRLFSTPQGSGDGNAYMPNTVDYGGQTYKQDNSGGFVGTGPLYGDKQYHFNNYDTSGAQTAEGEAQMSKWSPEMDFLKAMGALVGGGLAMGGPGAFGFGGAGGAGAGGMTNGAFLGEAPWTATGGGALDFGGTSAMGAGAGGAGGAAGAGGASYGTMAPIEQMAAPSYLSEAASLSPIATSGGSLLGKALGVGASLLGGALGSQGQQAEQSSTRDIPEWLKPYVTNTLDKSQSLFNTQMSPEYQQRWTNLGNQAQGLLAQPMAGNGFSRFFPGK